MKSVRGPGGGYLLGHGADGTRISDIILAVDEPIRATRCTPGAPMGCSGSKTRCLTHDLWEELGNQIHLYLSSVTLADVCAQRVLGRSGVLHRAARSVARRDAGHANDRRLASAVDSAMRTAYLDWNATAPVRARGARRRWPMRWRIPAIRRRCIARAARREAARARRGRGRRAGRRAAG